MRTFRLRLAVSAWLTAGALLSHAQITTGAIRGYVRDGSARRCPRRG